MYDATSRVLWLAACTMHLIQRGNNRGACFHADDDYRRYLNDLAVLSGQVGCQVHAYALMTNHVHLLLTPERTDSASLLMKHLGQRYVQYINRTYGRSGTLWDGRTSTFIDAHTRYLALERSAAARRAAYRALFRTDLDAEMLAEIRLATNGNFALGNQRFRTPIEGTLDWRVSRKAPGRPRRE